MRVHAHIGYEPGDDALHLLQARLHDDVHLTIGDPPASATYEILVAGRPSEALLSASCSLHTLIIPFAGLPAETRARLQSYPQVNVHNLHHNAAPTAEMALALLLAVARRLIPSHQAFRKNDWTPRYAPIPQVLLRGKTALILGYGSVGEHLGVILKAMGMRVLGTRRKRIDEAAGIYPPEALHELLVQANVLIVTLPDTDETFGLIGRVELMTMPRGSIVINVGRAGVVNQVALYQCLVNGHLFGAGLDVWYNYPSADEQSRQNTAPATMPFGELDSVVMSPHRGGGGGNDEIEALRMEALADALNAAAQGEAIPHRIELSRGY